MDSTLEDQERIDDRSFIKKLAGAIPTGEFIDAGITLVASVALLKAIPWFERTLEDTDKKIEGSEKVLSYIHSVFPSSVLDRAWNMGAVELITMMGPLLGMTILISLTLQYISNDIIARNVKASLIVALLVWVLDGARSIIQTFAVYVPLVLVLFPSILVFMK